jgi:nicotinamidase/pyrazinamidase
MMMAMISPRTRKDEMSAWPVRPAAAVIRGAVRANMPCVSPFGMKCRRGRAGWLPAGGAGSRNRPAASLMPAYEPRGYCRPVRALIICDVQNDFCEGGSLPVAGGDEVARAITSYLGSAEYDHVVATRDYHIDPGAHFSDRPDYVDTWPPHCVVGTDGAEFHPGLDIDRAEAVFSKGQHAAAYSGFEGTHDDGTPLAEWLRQRGVTDVDLAGLTTDHCVRASGVDAAREGFSTRVLLSMTAGVKPETTGRALAQLRNAGVVLDGNPIIRA